jgi:hypothetical protein
MRRGRAVAVGVRVPMVVAVRMFVGRVGGRWNHEEML